MSVATKSPGSKPFPGMAPGHEAMAPIHGQGIGSSRGGGKLHSLTGCDPSKGDGYAGHANCGMINAMEAHADRAHPVKRR